MTFVGIRIREDFAEIVTDTTSYLSNLRALARNTKCFTYPHLDAAIIAAGDGHWSHVSKMAIGVSLEQAETFDEVTTRAPEDLQRAWEIVNRDRKMECECSLFIVGYSPKRDRFVGWAFHSGVDFEPQEIEKLYVQPSPWFMKQPQHQIDSIMRDVERNWPGPENEVLRKKLENANTDFQVKDLKDWVELAMIAREQRALSGPFARVLVDGELFLHTIKVGSNSTMKMWDFREVDESGDEFVRMVEGSMHPTSQRGPCPCGKGEGKSYLEHCLPEYLDDPCTCGEPDVTIRECCMVSPDAPSSRPDVGAKRKTGRSAGEA